MPAALGLRRAQASYDKSFRSHDCVLESLQASWAASAMLAVGNQQLGVACKAF